MTEKETFEVLAVLAAAYPSKDLPESTINLYAQKIAGFPRKTAVAAVDRLVCTSKWFPSLAEVLEALTEDAAGDIPLWPAAWAEIQRAASSYGRNRTPEFTHPLIAEFVRRWGWSAICDQNPEYVPRGMSEAYSELRGRFGANLQAGRALPEHTKPQEIGE